GNRPGHPVQRLGRQIADRRRVEILATAARSAARKQGERRRRRDDGRTVHRPSLQVTCTDEPPASTGEATTCRLGPFGWVAAAPYARAAPWFMPMTEVRPADSARWR